MEKHDLCYCGCTETTSSKSFKKVQYTAVFSVLCFSYGIFSTFADWKGFTIKQREELFDQQQEEDKRMLITTLAHWRKITKETRLAKNMVSNYKYMVGNYKYMISNYKYILFFDYNLSLLYSYVATCQL